MASFLNHVAIAAPRNGTTTHTVDPSSGTVVTGALFTPTAGRFLVCMAQGAVTTFGATAGTAPTGWTLPTGGFAVNNSGLYMFYKTAAGSDTLTANHNGSNYTVLFDFYEFAAGTTFVQSASATGVANGGAGPSVTGLTGTNWIAGAMGQGGTNTTAQTVSWNTGTSAVSYSEAQNVTDGYVFGLTYLADSVLTSASATATSTQALAQERLMFALNVPTVVVYPSRPRVARYPTMRAAVI